METDHYGHSAVILDRFPMWLYAVERILENLGFESVDSSTDPTDALALLTERLPTLFVLDIDTDGASPDGLTCLKEAYSSKPSLKIVVVSASEDPVSIDTALTTGAVAYVLKRAEPADLSSAIRQVFTRSLFLADTAQSRPARSTEEHTAGLTPREQEILTLVAQGHTNGEVAGKLWVTEQTVKFHLANIFRKLDATNRTQASHWAHSHGLLGESAAALTPRGSAHNGAAAR